jgi:SAM-dependent methyltransferase
VEIGPGHVPFPVPGRVHVRYVDRWEPVENSSLFPELGESPGFPKPDIVSDLDVDRLALLADESQDFVIASHVIEHLANPLAMLIDIHRVLRTGGLLILLVPDRHRTFDRDRDPTPLDHLVDEYRRDVREVDDEHIIEYVIATSETNPRQPVSDVSPELIALHRRRSVHVHVWDVDEFRQVLEYLAEEHGVYWDVVDTLAPGERGTHGDEFGWLLARSTQPGRPMTAGRRWPSGRWRRGSGWEPGPSDPRSS